MTALISTGIPLLVLLVIFGHRLLFPAGSAEPLTREQIIQALTRLGALAYTEGQTLTLVVVGGAALVLRYNTRRSTRDVDAFMVVPPERRATRAWAEAVAREQGLPPDWLNDGAKGYMQGVSYGPLLLQAPGIVVYQVGSEQLLAMKLSAWRDEQDQADAETVLRDLASGYPSKTALWGAVAPFISHLRAHYAFEELWEHVYGDGEPSE